MDSQATIFNYSSNMKFKNIVSADWDIKLTAGNEAIGLIGSLNGIILLIKVNISQKQIELIAYILNE
jgi:hypothetical protein